MLKIHEFSFRLSLNERHIIKKMGSGYKKEYYLMFAEIYGTLIIQIRIFSKSKESLIKYTWNAIEEIMSTEYIGKRRNFELSWNYHRKSCRKLYIPVDRF